MRLQQLEAQGPIALVIDESLNGAEPSTLGHQYLLGIFPLTSVYFQHGVERQATELVVDALLEKGYRVVTAPPSAAPSAAAQVRPSVVIRPQIVGLRINGFDAVFFRMLDLSGELRVTFLSLDAEREVREVRRSLAETHYKKYAHAPLLANTFQRKVRSALEVALASEPTLRHSRLLSTAGAEAGAESFVVVELPYYVNPPALGIGKFIAASYGYDSVSALNNRALSRLIQRGVEVELSRGGTPFASIQSSAFPVPDHARALGIAIEALELEEETKLHLRTRFTSASGAQICEAHEPMAEHVDGAWVVTLENAAMHAFEKYRAGECGDG
ncbi:MAG: hypothetical protein U0136_00250 [Bdellovibrionota bacterium]